MLSVCLRNGRRGWAWLPRPASNFLCATIGRSYVNYEEYLIKSVQIRPMTIISFANLNSLIKLAKIKCDSAARRSLERDLILRSSMAVARSTFTEGWFSWIGGKVVLNSSNQFELRAEFEIATRSISHARTVRIHGSISLRRIEQKFRVRRKKWHEGAGDSKNPAHLQNISYF